MAKRPLTLGAVLGRIRKRNGWTLKEMSVRSGIPLSTLSKIERGRLSLSYDKLQQVAARLNIRMANLLADDSDPVQLPPMAGRRSIGTLSTAVRVDLDNYIQHFVCTDLRNKRMIPVIVRHNTTTIENFGDLIRHPGEEFVYVIKGRLIIHTECYGPVELSAGQSIYIDSGMGHAYLAASEDEETWSLGIMCSDDEDIASLPLTAQMPHKVPG